MERPQGQEYLQLTGHQQPVRAVAFHPNGKICATGSEDETLRIWDGGGVAPGTCMRVLRVPGPYVDMNITGATGLSPVQRRTLLTLVAHDFAERNISARTHFTPPSIDPGLGIF